MKRITTPISTTELCYYGCGNIAQFKNGSGNLMCCDTHNKCPALRLKNSSGVAKAHSDGLMTATFGNKQGWRKGSLTASFEYDGTGNHKQILINERGHRCEVCGNSEWLDKPITLELEHNDGDNRNNVKENLHLLCPNCHSQTTTWRRRKTKGGRTVYSDDEIIDAIQSSVTLNACLKKLNLKWGSGQHILQVMSTAGVRFQSAG